jgi:hypothetical protein
MPLWEGAWAKVPPTFSAVAATNSDDAADMISRCVHTVRVASWFIGQGS